MESGGIHVQPFLCSLPPMRGHMEHTLYPATKCNNVCDVLGKAIRDLNTQDFYWGLVMKVCSACHVPKFQTSRKKTGFNIDHIVCSNILGHAYHFGTVLYQCRTFYQLNSQIPTRELCYKHAFLKIAVSGLLY